MSKRKPTSVDVANLAGVSQSTVSRVFSDDPRIPTVTKERVLRVAQDLNYKPNAIARSLITQRTGIIAIVMTSITSPFYPYVLERFTHRLQEEGYQALLFSAPPGNDVDSILPLALQYQVDGLIITSATLSSAMIDRCMEEGTMVVLFNRIVRSKAVHCVSCDNEAGGTLVADLFVQAGHKRFGYIAGTPNTSTNVDRLRGYHMRLKALGQPEPMLIQGNYTYESGFTAALELLRRSDRPDAVFAANDITAMGALDAARHELGLRVPEDVSIIGFDDIPAAGWLAYSLTTIRQQIELMIDQTIAVLNAGVEAQPMTHLIPGKLVRRTSAQLAETTLD